jgi:hypothetical protein
MSRCTLLGLALASTGAVAHAESVPSLRQQSSGSLGLAALALELILSRRRRGALAAQPAEAKPAEDPTPVRG